MKTQRLNTRLLVLFLQVDPTTNNATLEKLNSNYLTVGYEPLFFKWGCSPTTKKQDLSGFVFFTCCRLLKKEVFSTSKPDKHCDALIEHPWYVFAPPVLRIKKCA